jgi:hypothetical protein
VAGLERASGRGLLGGGSADSLWDTEVGARLPHDLLEPDADHALGRPGDPLGSVDALREAVARVDAFFGELDRT